MNRRAALLIVVILLLAAASTWFSRESRQEAKQAVSSSVPDYFISDFTATQFGPDGLPVRRLQAVYLTHFPTRQMVVQEPHLTLFQHTGNPWEMTARTGALDDDANLVQLRGAVHLYRRGPEAADMVTESLRIQPGRHYAETGDPVTFTTAQGRMDAVGMDAWLDEQRVVLRSQVKGVYEQKTR